MKAIKRLKDLKIRRLIIQFVICNLLIFNLFTSPVFAVEVAPRISDREIVEKLSALDAKIDRFNAKIDIEIAAEQMNKKVGLFTHRLYCGV